MTTMTSLTSHRTLLVLLLPSRPHNRKIATANQKANQHQHDTQRANESALLHSRRLIDAFLCPPAIRPIGATSMRAKQCEFCVPLGKEMPYTSFANCTAAGGTPVPTR